MSSKISVIIPIYNSEKTLKRCVESVVLQSYDNLEIILVNDGSTDSSLEIFEHFKQIDSRVVVINQKNAGVSAARNAGIKASTGEFIQFVDADDYINSNMTEILFENMKKNSADLVICGYNRVSAGSKVAKIPSEFKSESLLAFKSCFEALYKNAFFNAPWNKLYRKSRIQNLFDETLSVGEDLLFNLCYTANCDKISVVSQALYNYDVTLLTSLAGKYDVNLLNTEIMLHKKVQEFYKTCFDSEDFRVVNSVFAKEVYYYLKKLVLISEDSKKVKLEKLQACFEDEFVKNTLNSASLSDSQVKILCMLMKLKCKRLIYLFFKLKNLFNNTAMR